MIVLDAVGAGELPDAAQFGDEGSNTLGNVARAVGGLDLPALEALGLGNVMELEGCPPQPGAPAVAGRLLERSKGKDTTTGHWELMGVVTPQAMPTYPHGFPDDVIDPFMNRTGRGVLGNKPASGTEIIQELGEEHQRTGKWIVYTSADSVFQIAAHEETIPLEELYAGCETAHATTHSDPVYDVDGVIHYCVANMPGGVPITSTKALTNATLPYVEAIAEHGLADAVARDKALAKGVNVLEGRITYEPVAEAHGLDYTPLDELLPV